MDFDIGILVHMLLFIKLWLTTDSCTYICKKKYKKHQMAIKSVYKLILPNCMFSDEKNGLASIIMDIP